MPDHSRYNAQADINSHYATDPAQEWGERVGTGEFIASGGEEQDEATEGSQDPSDPNGTARAGNQPDREDRLEQSPGRDRQ
jgi:hypothetical protein